MTRSSASCPPMCNRALMAQCSFAVAALCANHASTGQGVDPVTGTPEQFAAHARSEAPRFVKIVKAAGITPE